MSGTAIEIRALRFRYEAMEMLFDLAVTAGELLAITGPSGAGKSTLLSLIAGLEPPLSGSIVVDHRELVGLPAHARPVTMLFQSNNLFDHLDVATNVGLGISPRLALDATGWNRVEAALGRVGLAGFGRRLPGELSGGERQRVALARSLVRDKPILLLDEPFAALGPSQRRDMLDLVIDLQRERGTTVLLVTHQPEDARYAAGRLAFISAGRVLAIGATEEVLARSDIEELRLYLGDWRS